MSGFDDDDFADDKMDAEESEESAKDEPSPFDEEVPRSKKAKKSLGPDEDDDGEGGDEDYAEYEEKKEKSKQGPVYPYSKFVRFTGKISPLTRDEKGVVTQIKIENIDDKKVYPIEMNDNAKKLTRSLFQEIYITGEVIYKSEKETILLIKSYL